MFGQCTNIWDNSYYGTAPLDIQRHIGDTQVCPLFRHLLLHKSPNKMAAIWQTSSNAFSWLKIIIFWLKCQWSLCLKVHYENSLLLIYGKCLATNMRRAIIWTNDGLIYWHIHASCILNVLRPSWICSHKTTGNWQNEWHADKNEINYTIGNQILKSHQWI